MNIIEEDNINDTSVQQPAEHMECNDTQHSVHTLFLKHND